MKLFLDACVWGGAREKLQAEGHDVIWAGEWPEDPGDDEILERAYRGGRVLVTLDKDFGELAIVRGMPHAGIIRLVNLETSQQAATCLRVIELHEGDLEVGAIITAERHRLRVRLTTDREE